MKEGMIVVEVVENLAISFATEGSYTSSVWANFLDQLKKPGITKFLGTSMGTTEVTSVQRKSASDLCKVRKIPVVVITNASLVRGIVTAVSWLGVDIEAYDWPEIRKGLAHLSVTGSQQEQAVKIALRLKATHGR